MPRNDNPREKPRDPKKVMIRLGQMCIRDRVNDVYTALYNEDGTLLYGENPLAKDTAGIPFSDFNIQNVRTNSINYYIYDRALSRDGLDGFCLLYTSRCV